VVVAMAAEAAAGGGGKQAIGEERLVRSLTFVFPDAITKLRRSLNDAAQNTMLQRMEYP
jgi:hypothetical protein